MGVGERGAYKVVVWVGLMVGYIVKCPGSRLESGFNSEFRLDWFAEFLGLRRRIDPTCWQNGHFYVHKHSGANEDNSNSWTTILRGESFFYQLTIGRIVQIAT